jgi:hypothetical protein
MRNLGLAKMGSFPPFHYSRQQAELAVFRQIKGLSLEKLFGVVRVTVIEFSFGAFSDLHVSAFK